MAPAFDIRYDTAPQNRASRPRGPKITDLKTALSTFSSTSYTADRLNAMSYNDLVSAAVTHNLTVAGL